MLFGCLLFLVSLQFIVFDKINGCPRYLSDDSPFLLHNLVRPEHRKGTGGSENSPMETDELADASACILVCDDNHFLIGK